MKNVDFVVKNNMCISCGICKNICAKKCIEYKRDKGLFTPSIDESKCTNCGLCYSVCPGINYEYQSKDTSLNTILGPYQASLNAWSKDEQLRHIAASSGVVSKMVQSLLKQGAYDKVFAVDTYNCNDQIKTQFKTLDDYLNVGSSNVPKSRYLPVSHENLIEYILANREDRVIIIATSCATNGILNVIEKFKLNRQNYLFIGLFCDKVFNYNVVDYYRDFVVKKPIKEINFKNKDSGGWPGNMKFIFNDGSYCFVDKSERVKVKDSFMPERCMYCVDKLNTHADISIGDNFTDQNSTPLGSNSVLIRTQIGLDNWNNVCGDFEFENVNIEKIIKAQYLESRLNNLYFGQLKKNSIKKVYDTDIPFNLGIDVVENPIDYKFSWKRALRQILISANYKYKSIKRMQSAIYTRFVDLYYRICSKIDRLIHR